MLFTLERSVMHNVSSCIVLCGKDVKMKNDSFRLEKDVKIENEFDFWKLQRSIINGTLGYRVTSLWEDLRICNA